MAYQEKNLGGNGHVAIHDWAPVDIKGNHKSSGQIEHEIEDTRYSMDLLLDALSGKFNPRSIFDRFWDFFQSPENRNKAGDVLSHTGKRIADSFQNNPLPVLLMGTGAAWFIYESKNSRPQVSLDYQSRVVHPNYEEKEGFSEKLGRMKGEKSEDLKEKGEHFKDKVSEIGEKFSEKREQMQSQFQQSKEKADSMYHERLEQANNAVHQNPLIFGAAAALAGIFFGMLLPESSVEKKTMGKASSDLAQRGKEVATDIAEQGKDVASDIGSTVKETFQEGGAPKNEVQEGKTPGVLKDAIEKTEEQLRNRMPPENQ